MASMQLAHLLTNMKMPVGVEPLTVNLPSPPELKGALAPNNVLAQAVKFADTMVSGPESMVLSNGYVYTGLNDGYVVVIRPDGTRRRIRRMSVAGCDRSKAEGLCGRPLGVRERGGYLIVADAYHGIIALNPVKGDFRILVPGNTVVKGKKIGGFINDLAVGKDGSIYFTSSSSKYTRKDYLNVILEAETSGRVLVYNARFPGQQKVRELVTTLNFPNGLQLSKDEDFLLIAEGARARIHKAYIDRKSPKFGRIEVFANNLPGFVDNIRASPRGTYWVGLSRVRHAGQPSVLDDYGNQPRMRAAIMGMPREAVLAQAPNYGMVVELNSDGQVIRSLHDPTGAKFKGVSEIQEEKGTLYIGSFDNNFIGKLNLGDLPPIQQPPNPGTSSTDQLLAAFLNQIREKIAGMGPNQVHDVVISLVKYLVQVKLDAMRAEARVAQLEKDVSRLQAIIDARATTPSTPTTAGPPPATTTPGSGQTATTPGSGGTTPSSGGSGASSTAAPTTAPGTTGSGGGGGWATTPTTPSSSGAGSTTPGSGGSGSTPGASGTTPSSATADPGSTSATGTTPADAGSSSTGAGGHTGSTAAGTTPASSTSAASGSTASGPTGSTGSDGTTTNAP